MDLLTFDEAQDFLKLEPWTLKRLTRNGEIPSRKMGKRLLYLRSDLIAWFDAQPLAHGKAR